MVAKKKKTDDGIIVRNKRARFDYEILEKFEAGIELLGSEVKSLREKRASLQEAYAKIEHGQLFLIGATIEPYLNARNGGHSGNRQRKLLMHKKEVIRIADKLAQKGLTLVPLCMRFRGPWAKIELALAKGKAQHDKRQSLYKDIHKREMNSSF